MIEWRPRRLGLGLWHTVEIAFQHGFDVLVGISPVPQRPLGDGLQSLMAVLVTEVRRATKMKVGVNILRNACAEALSIAEVCGADFIRCNVVIGAYVTDQGIIQGCAAELARLRRSLGSEVLIFGDVHVKHAHPLFDVPIEYAAQVTVQVEEHGPQPIRQLHGIDSDYGHFVTYGNEMTRPRGDP